jgi:hypothetical protein
MGIHGRRLALVATTAELDLPTVLNRPDAGNERFRAVASIRNGRGEMEPPDSDTVYMRLLETDGTVLSSRLYDAATGGSVLTASADGDFPSGSGWYQQDVSISDGRFEAFLQIASGDTEAGYTVELGWKERGKINYTARKTRIGDQADLDDVQSDVTGIDTKIGSPVTSVSADLAVVDGVVDAILVDTGTTLPATLGTPAGASIAADIAAVDADLATVDTNVDAILVDTGTTLPATLSGIEGKVDTVDTNVDAILADTADMQPKLGTPAAASISADIAVIDANVDAVLVDTAAIDSAVGNVNYGLAAAETQRDAIETAIAAIQNNTGFSSTVPQEMILPPSGSVAHEMTALVFDSSGNMEDPTNQEVLVRLRKADGTYITDRLFKTNALSVALDNPTNTTDFPVASGWRAMEREALGKMFMFYKNAAGQTEEPLVAEFGYEITTVEKYQHRTMTVTSTPSDTETKVDTIQANLGSFQGQTNLLSLLATLGNEWEDHDLSIDDLLMGRFQLLGVSAPAAGSFTVAQVGVAPPAPTGFDDWYNNHVILVVAGTNVGSYNKITDYNATTKVATLAISITYATDDVFVVVAEETIIQTIGGDGLFTTADTTDQGTLWAAMVALLGDPTADTLASLTAKLGDSGDAASTNTVLGQIGDPTDALVQNDGSTEGSLFAKIRALGDMTSYTASFRTLAEILGDVADVAQDPDLGNGSIVAYLRHIVDEIEAVAAGGGVQRVKWEGYLREGAAVLSADPFWDYGNMTGSGGGAGTSSTSEVVLESKDIELPSGSEVAYGMDVLLDWKSLMTAGDGPDTGKTRWYVAPRSSLPIANGDAVSGITGAQAITDQIAASTVETNHTRSGALPASTYSGTGGIVLILAGLCDGGTTDVLDVSVGSNSVVGIDYKA